MKRLFFTVVAAALSVTLSAQIRVACVGNSVTYGAGIEGRDSLSYPAVLGAALGTEYRVGNFGLNGATLLSNGHNPYIKSGQYKAAIEMKPDIVVIHLGLNDTDPRNYPIYQEEFLGDYLSLIDSFRNANPGVRIIIARLSPIFHWHWRFNAGTREWHRKIQQEIEQVAKTADCELIDFYEVLHNRPDLLPDCIHPNAEGAAMLAQRVYSAITGDFGGLSLSPLYTDNMVLQRGDSTIICGQADAAERITVEINYNGRVIKQNTISNINGKWSTRLPLTEYGDGYNLEIATGRRKIALNNVAVGEVWLLGGQSNMSFSAAQSDSSELIKADSNIRLFMCNPSFERQDSLPDEILDRLNRLDYIRSDGWSPASVDQIRQFSAVGYYFARRLTGEIPGVRVGLIQTSLGGATAESFVKRQMMEDDPILVQMLYDWWRNPMIMQWCRDIMGQSLRGAKVKNQRHFFEPTFLYESRIAPLGGYSIKGVLWYQGESNAENTELHETIFPAVVSSFRKAFGSKELPFYFVQLSSLNRPSWCRFRESQLRISQQIENCEMVVSSDYGDPTDVHPRTKNVIGERLANVALARDYGFRHIAYRSPKAATLSGSVITFENCAPPLHTSDGLAPRGFEAAEEDGIFHEVDAKIVGCTIVISHKNPKFVRYGWKPYTDANLTGGTSLPVSTFIICQKEK